MKFIKISNDADYVNRLYLEKLGLSSKRDDEETIGQFGSGSKFAPIAALRKNIRWISVGEDENGPYQLEFVCIPENGINDIYCKYENELKATSFTLEAGMLSWEDDFQIFREAFANAMDENISSDAQYEVSVVDEVKFEAGKFIVYLSATPGLLDIVNNFDNYFSFNREVLFQYTTNGSKIFSVSGPKMRIFNKHILVYEGSNDSPPSIFDYNFKDLILNEERRIRYDSDIYRGIVQILAKMYSFNDDDVALARRFIEQGMMTSKWETTQISDDYVYSYDFDNDSAFNAAFVDLYGDKACISRPDHLGKKGEFRLKGYKPVFVESKMLYKILMYSGITTAEDVLDKVPEYDVFDLPPKQQEMLDSCVALVKKIWPEEVAKVNSIQAYIPSGTQDEILGVRDGDDIYLSIRSFTDKELLISVIVHELDHLVYDYRYHDEGFRVLADNRIGKLLIMLEGKL